jgi:hypothetical protein
MYPPIYDGRIWQKKDCDETFQKLYNGILNEDGSIFIDENVKLYPDGGIKNDGRRIIRSDRSICFLGCRNI